MTSDFSGFNFLQAVLPAPADDIRRGYGLGHETPLDIIRRGYDLGGAATPDTTQHGTSTYLALPQS